MVGIRLQLFTVLLKVYLVSGYVEELDGTFSETREDDLWLVEFYAPWCDYCKVFEQVWYEVGAELKSLGSPVNVGKIDTTVHTNIASKFSIRGYPTIKLFKGETSYEYKGPRTKEAIIEYTNRVAGPVVRTLSSPQLLQHVMSRHDVLFVYVGDESPLKDKFLKVAADFIIHTYFFIASEKILPKAVSLDDVPAVVVFKDGTFYTYNEYLDGRLSTWVNQERYLGFQQIDSYTLYQMGDTLTKLVALAVVDEKNPSAESIRYKTLMERVATEYRDHYNKEFVFGYINGSEYISGYTMSEIAMPSIIVMNMSNDGYFLPDTEVETLEDLVMFLNHVLDGHSKLGGNGIPQRLHRLFYNLKKSVVSSPGFFCMILCLPLGILTCVCYGAYTAVPDDGAPEEAAPLLTRDTGDAAQGVGAQEQKPEGGVKSLEAKKED